LGGHYHHHGIKHFLGHRITRWEKRERDREKEKEKRKEKETGRKKKRDKETCLPRCQSVIHSPMLHNP
jgi:hypothetical protein